MIPVAPVDHRYSRCFTGALAASVALCATVAVAGRDPEPPPPFALDVAVREGVAYAAWSNGLVTVDVRAPEKPEEIGRLELRASLHGIALDGPRAVVAAGSHGLLIVDISDPAEPEPLSRLDTSGSARAVVSAPPYAYVADGAGGLLVVDLRDPRRPRRIASWSTRSQIRGVAAGGGALVTAEGGAGARLFDLRRPDRPIELGPVDPTVHALDVAIVPPWIAIAAPRGELRVYRLDDRLRPTLERSVTLAGEIDSLGAAGEHVWVACGERGGWWIDLSWSTPPVEIALPGRVPAGRGDWVDGTLVLAAGSAGLAIVEVPEGSPPRVLVPREHSIRIEWE